jgi:hypothetical protein
VTGPHAARAAVYSLCAVGRRRPHGGGNEYFMGYTELLLFCCYTVVALIIHCFMG